MGLVWDFGGVSNKFPSSLHGSVWDLHSIGMEKKHKKTKLPRAPDRNILVRCLYPLNSFIVRFLCYHWPLEPTLDCFFSSEWWPAGCVDGTCYARLKPGADLKHLEARGGGSCCWVADSDYLCDFLAFLWPGLKKDRPIVVGFLLSLQDNLHTNILRDGF